jgi:hypothetical protein
MGLAGVGPTVADTLIAFAAKAGSVSYDGDGRNSPFTTALLKYITQPGLDIRLALGKVRDDVLRATNHRQEPYVYGSLGGEDVALVPAPVAAAPSVAAVPPATPSPAAAPPANADADEASDYRTTERFASLDGWRAFLAVHPDGAYARLARAEVDKLLARQKIEAAKTEAAPMVTARTEVAPPLSPEALCERDADRLVHLRANPTNEEASRFASELSCEKLRPQLSRLMESLGFAMPAPAPQAPVTSPPTAQAAVAERKPASDCASEQAALDHLRAEPSIDEAQAFWRGLQCERLRPRRACSWRASISSSRSQARILCWELRRPRCLRRRMTYARSWRPAIASRRTRPPAIERSKSSTACEPIPTDGTRNASPGR